MHPSIIYLASLPSLDLVLLEEQDRVEKLNKKLIEDYDKLPFYKKWFTDSPMEVIRENWHAFDRFQDRRMKQMELQNLNTH